MPYKDKEKRKLYERERSRKRRFLNAEYFRFYGVKWRKKHPGYYKERDKEYYSDSEKNFKRKCRLVLNMAIKFGFIKKQNYCSRCSKKDKVEGHHEDYKKPLEVVWLCRKCHLNEHML